MCVNNYGFSKLTIGMELPKYKFEDLVNTLAKSTSDWKKFLYPLPEFQKICQFL